MNEETLFHEALAKPSGDRRTFLDAVCAGKPELRAAVDARLAAHDASASLPDRAATDHGHTVDPNSALELGATSDHTPQPGPATSLLVPTSRLDQSSLADSTSLLDSTTNRRSGAGLGLVIAGRYMLVEKIGEGGMGEVWIAQQIEPVKRKVALKLIKAGLDSQTVLARFEQERQALALMDHPNIARVLDGGMTGEGIRDWGFGVSAERTDASAPAPNPQPQTPVQGQPFFVMELVSGLPLTKFCDEAKLTPRERLELFVPICQAVQHAHQKGIVHRDLKPANILVTMIDGRPVPKVIDFGVAKATAGKLTDQSLATQFGSVVGTLEYMSPEQASLSGEDIDTRADIYSLGVILYELLTGLRPIDARRLRKAALTEMIRIIQEEEPAKPSTRLYTNESLPSLAALRQTEPRRLMAILRGELDWIVMKCLEKDRSRRYETANGLARDIQRHLADEPVDARPPSFGYRAGKMLRRNKGPVVAASLVLLALVGGFVGTAIGLLEARRQEAIARDEATAKGLALQAEPRQLEIAQENERRAERAYDKAANVLDTMTSEITERAIIRQKEISDDQKKFLTEALAYYREFAATKADSEKQQLRAARAAYRVAVIEGRLNRLDASVAAYRTASEMFARLAADFLATPASRQSQAVMHNNIGVALNEMGRPADAEVEYRMALALRQKLADEFPNKPELRQELAATQTNLAAVTGKSGGPEAKADRYADILATQEKLVADFPDDPRFRHDLSKARCNLANELARAGNFADADEQFARTLALQQKLATEFPADPEYRQSLARTYAGLGAANAAQRKPAESEAEYKKAVALFDALATELPSVPQYRQELAITRLNLGNELINQSKLAEGEDQYLKAVTLFEKLVADAPGEQIYRRQLISNHENLSIILRATGRDAEAAEHTRKAATHRESLKASQQNPVDQSEKP